MPAPGKQIAVRSMDTMAGIVRRAEKAKDKMRQWFPLYEELAHYFYNIRKGFLITETPGQEFDVDIWDSSPETHRTRLSQSFVEAMCPRDRYWVGLQPARIELLQDDEIRLWCQLAAYYMYLVINDPQANFIESINELADDTCSFGSGVIYVDFKRKGGYLTFQVKHLKDMAFETDSEGKVLSAYCYWKMSLDDIVREFGIEALPQEMADEYRNPNNIASCSEKRHEIIHAVLPSDDFARYGAGIGRMAYQSLWILKTGSHLLDKGGYNDMPYILVRWYRKSGEAMGRCDSMRALADARLIQSVAASLLEITEKQSNPPMQAPIDIIRGNVELWPGGINFFEMSGFQFQGDPIRPIQLGDNPAMTSEYLKYLDQKIGRVFYSDLLSLPEEGMDPQQHLAMEMMKATVLAPLWSRVENETLPPILDRVFNIMLRLRALPPIPDKLVGERLVYKLDNKISDMRDMAKAQQTWQAIGAPLQLQHPDIVQSAVENLDTDVAIRTLWQMMKVPQNFIRNAAEVAADRQQRQQYQQMQAMAEMAKAGGPGVKQAIEGAVNARDQGLLPTG